MQDGIKPGTIMLIAGGAVMFIASLLDWADFGSGGTALRGNDARRQVWRRTQVHRAGVTRGSEAASCGLYPSH